MRVSSAYIVTMMRTVIVPGATVASLQREFAETGESHGISRDEVEFLGEER